MSVSNCDSDSQPETQRRNMYIILSSSTFGCRSLSQLSGHTFVELTVVRNPRFVVIISIIYVIVSEIKVFPVLTAVIITVPVIGRYRSRVDTFFRARRDRISQIRTLWRWPQL